MLDHPDIDAISFVGSAPVAQLVYERAAQTGSASSALGGAKNHMVICPDAVVETHRQRLIGSGWRRRPALYGRLGDRHRGLGP